MKEFDIKKANEIDNNNAGTYYFEELESVPKMLYNAFELFNEPDISEDVHQISETMNADKYIKCNAAVMNPANAKHLASQQFQLNHVEVPSEEAPTFLGGVAKSLEYIDMLEKKFPDEKSVERRVLAIIRNHAKLVTENKNYLDALSIDPSYAQIIDSIFATFPVPFFLSGKDEKNNNIYEYNKDKYLKLINGMKMLETLEFKQKFFMEQVIPYANAVKDGTLTDREAANYRMKYRKHIPVLRELTYHISELALDKKNYEECKTFIDNSFKLNYVDRLSDAIGLSVSSEIKLLDKGWPVADMPLLGDIIQWYKSIQKTAEKDPSSFGYNKSLSDAAKAAINDIKPLYDKLMEATIISAKQRKELLKEFNVIYRKYEKSYGSMNGLNSTYIEERAEVSYNPYAFKKIADDYANEKNAKIFESINNAYYTKTDNVNKADVILRCTEISQRLPDYAMSGGPNTINELNKISIYDMEEITGLFDVEDALLQDYVNSYPGDPEGILELYTDIGTLKAKVALQLGKEREQFRNKVDKNDPDIERKLDFLTNEAGGASATLASLQDVTRCIGLALLDKQKHPYDSIVKKLENEGRAIDDITIGELIEMCGYEPSYGLEALSRSFAFPVRPGDNYRECIMKNAHIPTDGDITEKDAVTIRENMQNQILRIFMHAGLLRATARYREGLSVSDRELFDKGFILCDPNYFSKLNKSAVPERKEQYENWVNNEGAAIVSGVRVSNHYDYLKKNMEFFTKDVRVSESELDISENAVNLNNYYRLLDDNTHWYKGGSSRNFDNMMKALDRLRTYSDKLSAYNREPDESELEEYLKLAIKTEELATFYLEKKGVGNSEYARRRIELVTDIRNRLKNNIELFTEKYENIQRDEVKLINENNSKRETVFTEMDEISEKCAIYYAQGKEFRKLYQSDAYDDAILEKLPRGSYTLDRNAGYAIAIMALCAAKDENGNRLYTFDDIMDNTKLVNEKREMFDKVVKMIGQTAKTNSDEQIHEANSWIADVIYNGQKVSVEMVDEELRKIPFSDKNVLKSDRFIKLMAMGAVQFDAWQEMAHCEQEIMELVRRDHPKLNTYEKYKEYVTEINGPLANADVSVFKLKSEYDKIQKGHAPDYVNVVKDNLQIQYALNMYSEWERTGGKKPFSKWCAEGCRMQKYSNILTAGMNLVCSIDEIDNSDMRDWMLESIADGSMFAGVKYKEPDNQPVYIVESAGETSNIPLEEGRYDDAASPFFVGIPKFKELAKEWKVINQDKEKLKKQLKDSAVRLDGYIKKANDKVALTYIKQAKKSVKDIYDIINENRKLIGADRENAIKAVKRITAFRFMREFEKAGIHGQDLKTAVNAAMTLVPELDKNMEYLSKTFLSDIAFTDKGKTIAKASRNSMFAGKAAIAIKNLENNDYTGRNGDFIRDAAYAMTAQQLRVNGSLKDTRTGITIPPEKYAEKLIKSNAFKESLKAGEPKKYIAPANVAKMAKNDKAYRAKQAEEKQIKEQKLRVSKVNDELRVTLNNRNSKANYNTNSGRRSSVSSKK